MPIAPLSDRRPTVPAAAPAGPGAQDHPPLLATLDLTSAQPIAEGAERRVYLHPHQPALLIKIVKPLRRKGAGKRPPLRHWHKRFQREGLYRSHLAELAEYAAARHHAGHDWNVPMARILGLIQTSEGLGLLVEKISGESGALAPTVQAIVDEHGLEPALAQALDALFDTLADHHIILNDVSARNIVLGRNADGRHGLYLIDGFGSKQAIPLYALSKALNRRRLRRKYAVMKQKLEARSRERAAWVTPGA